MYQSPSTSPPTTPFALLGCAMGAYLAYLGVRIIIRKETKIGPKGGPYDTVYGKEAVQVGLGFILMGLFFFVFGVMSLIKIYNVH